MPLFKVFVDVWMLIVVDVWMLIVIRQHTVFKNYLFNLIGNECNSISCKIYL